MGSMSESNFVTKGQYNKYLKIKGIFDHFIDLYEEGNIFFIDDERWDVPFIEDHEIGFRSGSYTLLFTGSEFDLNPETNEYDILWISITLKELRKRIEIYKKNTWRF